MNLREIKPDITVQKDEILTISNSDDIGTLINFGTVQFEDKDITLNVDSIRGNGTFIIGSDDDRITKNIKINLTHPDFKQREFMVMSGGELHIHGKEKTPFLRLSKVAKKQIEVDDVPEGWNIGDEIIITAFEPCRKIEDEQTEKFTIKNITGKIIDLDREPDYFHNTEIWYVDKNGNFGKSPKSKKVDARSYVANLTRNIQITSITTEHKSKRASDKVPKGGHLMVMNGANAYIENAEFIGMGQMEEPGRYPVHFHQNTDNKGDNYLRGLVVNGSHHRGIVTHGNNYTVEDCVIYDVFSHGFVVAEDGFEVGNVYKRCLAARVKDLFFKSKSNNHFAFWDEGKTDPSNGQPLKISNGSTSQHERHAMSYWIHGTDHIIENCISAGGHQNIGYGYTFLSAKFGSFNRNEGYAHGTEASTGNDGDSIHYRVDGMTLFTHAHDGVNKLFRNLLAINDGHMGAWLESSGDVLKNSIMIGCGKPVNAMRATIVKNLFIRFMPDGRSVSFKDDEGGGIEIRADHKTIGRNPSIKSNIFVGYSQGVKVENDPTRDKFENNANLGIPTISKGNKFIGVDKKYVFEYPAEGAIYDADEKKLYFRDGIEDANDWMAIEITGAENLGKVTYSDFDFYYTELYEPYDDRFQANQKAYVQGNHSLAIENWDKMDSYELQIHGLKGAITIEFPEPVKINEDIASKHTLKRGVYSVTK